MSEDQIKEALGAMEFSEVQEESATEAEPEATASEDSDDLTDIEREAVEAGWDRDRYLSNPESSASAYEYVRYGKLQDQFSQLENRFKKKESEFESQLDDVKLLYKLQLEQKIAALKAEARNAVEEADTDKYERTQSQIDDLNKQAKEYAAPSSTQPQEPEEVTAWKAKNSWINDRDDPRAHAAAGLWDAYVSQNPGATAQQALAYVDAKIKDSFGVPKTNPRRDMPGLTESTPKSAKKKTRGLTMADLTQEEKDTWRNTGHLFWGDDEKGQKRFLEAVANSR